MGVVRAIARQTAREILHGGLFFGLAALAAALVFFSQFLPFFGESESDVKLVKDMGFASVVLAGGILAVLYASSALAEEMENRTALMVLAKPVTRAQFVVGKYLGILGAEVLFFAVVGSVLVFTVWHKESYVEAVFRSAPLDPAVFQGILLAYVEVAVLAAFGVALSSFLSAAPASAAAALVFVGGHVGNALPLATSGFGNFLWAWFPDLALLRISDALALEIRIPWSHVALAGFYGALMSVLALTVACWRLDVKDAA